MQFVSRFSYSFPLFPVLFLGVILSGCVYKFTNKHVKKPGGIKTIAIESIYDTSREVLPHELLWGSIQEAIVEDGNLILASRQDADAIMRVHLKNAFTGDIGDTKKIDATDSDPKPFSSDLPDDPKEYRKLTRAGRIKETASLRALIQVEVIHIQSRDVLFRRNYSMATTLRTFRTSASGSGATTRGNEFLRFEEAKDYKFKYQCQAIARRIVKDLLAP